MALAKGVKVVGYFDCPGGGAVDLHLAMESTWIEEIVDADGVRQIVKLKEQLMLPAPGH